MNTNRIRAQRFALAGALALACTATSAVAAVRAEVAQGFTIPPGERTPLVLETAPDAACDLHVAGATDPAHTLRLYANGDGYVKVHVHASQVTEEDVQLQLDCTAAGQVTTYPLRLRAGGAPTTDMPAPLTIVPTPKGSRVLPALTAESARQFSDEELTRLGYLPRPDATESPEAYAKWLKLVSQPITLLPRHLVSRSDISHRAQDDIEASTESSHWSGYVAQDSAPSYIMVTGEWHVPGIVGEYPGDTYSAFWVGLDGYGTTDSLQAGTEQDFVFFGGFFDSTNYAAWTEVLPNQTSEQDTNLSPNPGDEVYVQVWIGDDEGNPNGKGSWAWAYLVDSTQRAAVSVRTPLSGTHFSGKSAEWIMERPLVNNVPAILSDFNGVSMTDAYAYYRKKTAEPRVPAQTASTTKLALHNEYVNGNDNNLLSEAQAFGSSWLYFTWYNFH
jgi:hypothetical protein